MKIYTKTGDEGETGLFGGRRVSKADSRVEAYGSVDELNAHLGWALTQLRSLPLEEKLRSIQSDLFTLGADLATPPDASSKTRANSIQVGPERVEQLETWIDAWEAELEPLKHFILPGGDPGAAALQICRAVCRRAERHLVRLSQQESIHDISVVYLNRLSDLLFVLARWVNARAGAKEPIWEGKGDQA